MGRPAVVPPAGKGRGLDARPCRGAGGKEGGALSTKAPREVRPARRSEPYLGDAGVCVDREDSIPTCENETETTNR